MAYHYKLEQIRHLREQERQQAQLKFLETLHKLEEAENELATAMAKEHEAARHSGPTSEQPRSVLRIQEQQAYLDYRRQMTKQQQLKRDRLQQKFHSKQKELRERRISEQIMNKLRQKDYLNYCYEEKRRDDRLMDEIAVTHYQRYG